MKSAALSARNKQGMGELSHHLVEAASKAGARHADALAVADTGNSISVRNGCVESVEREDGCGIGLRVFVETAKGLAFASASSSDVSPAGLRALAEQVVAMARISEPDPDSIPPVGADHPDAADVASWQKCHPDREAGWSLDDARQSALACEEAARSFSSEITNSEGADASFGTTHVAYASSDGFAADYAKSSASLSVSVIAGTGDGMQRDYAWHRALHISSLRSAEDIAREAASRAVSRLGSKAMQSGKATVLFEPRTATSLLGHLIGAINGRAVLQKRTFLAECAGQKIFPDFVNIDDDPDHPEGMANRLFDGEGTRCSPSTLIDAGQLTGFMTDRYAAGRLKTRATGHARRGLTGDTSIGPSNLIWRAGKLDQQAIINTIKHGLLVTELIGFGVNGVTGDYSRGAGGFLIQDGKIVRPVQGITIAGNLKDMFAGIVHVGSDMTWFGSTAVPSIAIEGMTVAGE